MKRISSLNLLRFSFSRLILSLLFTAPFLLSAQIYTGDLRLNNQAAVDAFSYTKVTGNLAIAGTDINNLNSLSSLNSVGGKLSITTTYITNLDDLSSLTSVGHLAVVNNYKLNNLDGLSSLNSVGTILRIHYNKTLSEFCGLYPLLNGGGYKGGMRAYTVEENRKNPTQQEIISEGPCVQDPFTLIKNMLTNGTLNQGQANALNTKLNNCKLNAFNNQINDWGSTGILTQRQANNLIQAAAGHCK